ncbi:hypothetical protein CAPTEDRAFT_206436 [Capitella teleta]|uniref:Uncharacterized protein n=1 Tax=Capitella teleta TaxID=283909 RepID=R7T8V4_CAPTE|nr:hypothetical protein CAPTEDRAFT_206436 [Capitella teleta]|eukprot:ELT90060.1 hypothetical protein CAPTEDRAFT_206436 [Capitella teleta]
MTCEHHEGSTLLLDTQHSTFPCSRMGPISHGSFGIIHLDLGLKLPCFVEGDICSCIADAAVKDPFLVHLITAAANDEHAIYSAEHSGASPLSMVDDIDNAFLSSLELLAIGHDANDCGLRCPPRRMLGLVWAAIPYYLLKRHQGNVISSFRSRDLGCNVGVSGRIWNDCDVIEASGWFLKRVGGGTTQRSCMSTHISCKEHQVKDSTYHD